MSNAFSRKECHAFNQFDQNRSLSGFILFLVYHQQCYFTGTWASESSPKALFNIFGLSLSQPIAAFIRKNRNLWSGDFQYSFCHYDVYLKSGSHQAAYQIFDSLGKNHRISCFCFLHYGNLCLWMLFPDASPSSGKYRKGENRLCSILTSCYLCCSHFLLWKSSEDECLFQRRPG